MLDYLPLKLVCLIYIPGDEFVAIHMYHSGLFSERLNSKVDPCIFKVIIFHFAGSCNYA